MRDNWLSNRVLNSYDDLVDHCCEAWNKLVDQPWRIMSIGLREWKRPFTPKNWSVAQGQERTFGSQSALVSLAYKLRPLAYDPPASLQNSYFEHRCIL